MSSPLAAPGARYPLKLVNWNVEWATPRSQRYDEIVSRIRRHAPEIVCLTETHPGLLECGYAIGAQPDYGYGIREDRRKALLWSKTPWKHVDDVGDPRLPPGRFISGVTETSLGEMTVVGLCIPWEGSRAGTRYGGERRRAWEDHETYLEHLAGILSGAPSKRLLVMGDFNQRVGVGGSRSLQARRSGRAHRAALLRKALPPQITLATAALGYRGRRTIDHVALSADIAVEALSVISNIHEGRRLSDHFGVVAELGMHAARQSASPGGST